MMEIIVLRLVQSYGLQKNKFGKEIYGNWSEWTFGAVSIPKCPNLFRYTFEVITNFESSPVKVNILTLI